MCQRDADVFDDVQPVPLVVHHDDFALEGMAGGVTVFLGKFAVDSPLQVEGILGFDEFRVRVAVGNPLAVNLHLCARDVEDDALVVALAERCCACSFHRGGKIGRHAIFLEKSCRIDEVKGLSLTI